MPLPYTSRFLMAFGLLAALLAGCGQPPKPEATPAAPVKWEPASSVVLEQWTELVGTTQPPPEGVAHITAPIEGRVVSLLKNAAGEPIHEGDEVILREASQKVCRQSNVRKGECRRQPRGCHEI